MNNQLKVIAIVINSSYVTLYKEDGSTIDITQGKLYSTKVVEKALQDIEKQGYANIKLNENSIDSGYLELQQQSKVVKFMRVAKKYLNNLFGTQKVQYSIEPEARIQESKKKHKKAVEDILSAAPETVAKRVDLDVSKDTQSSMVAIVDDTVIPNATAMAAQVNHANNLKHYKGLDNFMKRVAKVIHERQHSVEDLMKFLEKADLPIMDDGSILAYKRVNACDEDNVYVDVHSGKVKQWVGCRVCMPVDLVDPDRSRDCSNGLHVARRQYLKTFLGNTILFLKVKPEDVIAVPTYDPNKVRVTSYDIIGKANDSMFKALLNDKAINTPIFQNILSNYCAGIHPPMKKLVTITGHNGTGLQYTDLNEATVKTETKVKQKPVDIEEVTDSATKGETVNVSDLVQKVKTKTSEKERMLALLPVNNRRDANTLMAWKRRQKKSWEKLGVTKAQGAVIKDLAD